MLANYHKEPYDLDFKNLTFSGVWRYVEQTLEHNVEDGKMSQNNYDCLVSAYNNHCYPLYNIKILDLRYKKMQQVIDDATNKNDGKPLSPTTKGFIKTVCVKIFNCAIDELELPISKNPAINLKCGVKQKSNKHMPFTDDEISILWGLQHMDLVKITLIWLYTGLRPNEIFKTKREDIFIDENYFITGSKTKAGKNRVIPIHNKIKHLIMYFYNKNDTFPFNTLYSKNMNYSKVKREFSKLMDNLKFNHTPYDCRHTFTTKMKKAGANEYMLKLIIGHSIKDITESVYTHRDIQDLVTEVNKIN